MIRITLIVMGGHWFLRLVLVRGESFLNGIGGGTGSTMKKACEITLGYASGVAPECLQS